MSGCSSGVEHNLAKVGVERSNRFTRSNYSTIRPRFTPRPSSFLAGGKRPTIHLDATSSFFTPVRRLAPMVAARNRFGATVTVPGKVRSGFRPQLRENKEMERFRDSKDSGGALPTFRRFDHPPGAVFVGDEDCRAHQLHGAEQRIDLVGAP